MTYIKICNRIGQAQKLGKQNRNFPEMDSNMLLTYGLTPICPNSQLPNIEGLDTSVTTDILLPTTTEDVLEEVSECPENESLHVSNKNHDICINDEIDADKQSFDTPIKHNHDNV